MKTQFVLALALFSASVGAQQLPADMQVATIASVSGDVLLAQHAHIGPAAEGALLKAGDRLMSMDHSDALVAFADGCRQHLEPNSMLTIGEVSNCRGMRALSFGQAIGETGASTDEEKNKKKAAAVLTSGQKTAITAAVIIPLLYLWDRNRDDDDRKPVSR